MNPMVILLLGASAPNTNGGTMHGATSPAAVPRRKVRREMREVAVSVRAVVGFISINNCKCSVRFGHGGDEAPNGHARQLAGSFGSCPQVRAFPSQGAALSPTG